MKKKQTPYTCYDDMLSDYYGCHRPPRKKRKTLTMSFDNGEIIPAKDSESFREYIVATSQDKDGDAFDEYVVQSYSVAEDKNDEEYVVQSFSYSNDSYESPYQGTDFISTSSTVSKNQDLQTDVLDPLSTEKAADLPSPDKPDTDALINDIKNIQQQSPATSSVPADNSGSLSSSEEEIVNDLQAILSGKKVYDPASKKTVNRDELGKQQSVDDSKAAPANDPGFKNEHAIFDRIAQNMKYANAYDLGTIQVNTEELNNRFNEFDKVPDAPPRRPTPPAAPAPAPTPVSQQEDFDPSEFIRDLDEMRKQGQSQPVATVEAQPAPSTQMSPPGATTAEFPPRPTNLRPITTQERAAEFGTFAYVADPTTFNGDGIRVTDNWVHDNITSVNIPQLNGKLANGRPIQHGAILFHRAGADRLQRLWAAWETAGLLDRILSFEGGYAARFIRHTEGRSPRPLSNHSWGTAFDINAAENPFGQEPAQMGHTGCVRELVAIANQNGFFWGGHFSGHKDGMHFELGKAI